ncbi:MAG: hypothetical protein K1X53_09835 [Candidatus Sumerlaeaceae bacterium]|nr:hypothetical protein [Candidatus Sumerlaeaceae bacterium]
MKMQINAELPEELVLKAKALVADGWASDLDSILIEALRRYLESHSSQVAEAFIREDAAWGLYGKD